MGAYNIVGATTLVAGQPEDVSQVLANLQAIQAVLNGGIDDSNINASAAIALSKLASIPGAVTGDIKMWPVTAAPTGWLLCDGSAVSRSTYAALFTLLNSDGLKFGVGDGSTTFNVPDLRGRTAVMPGTHADVTTLGQSDGGAVGNRSPKHNHTVAWGGPGGNPISYGGGAGANQDGSGGTSTYYQNVPLVGLTGRLTDTGGYLVMQHVIKT